MYTSAKTTDSSIELKKVYSFFLRIRNVFHFLKSLKSYRLVERGSFLMCLKLFAIIIDYLVSHVFFIFTVYTVNKANTIFTFKFHSIIGKF